MNGTIIRHRPECTGGSVREWVGAWGDLMSSCDGCGRSCVIAPGDGEASTTHDTEPETTSEATTESAGPRFRKLCPHCLAEPALDQRDGHNGIGARCADTAAARRATKRRKPTTEGNDQ